MPTAAAPAIRKDLRRISSLLLTSCGVLEFLSPFTSYPSVPPPNRKHSRALERSPDSSKSCELIRASSYADTLIITRCERCSNSSTSPVRSRMARVRSEPRPLGSVLRRTRDCIYKTTDLVTHAFPRDAGRRYPPPGKGHLRQCWSSDRRSAPNSVQRKASPRLAGCSSGRLP